MYPVHKSGFCMPEQWDSAVSEVFQRSAWLISETILKSAAVYPPCPSLYASLLFLGPPRTIVPPYEGTTAFAALKVSAALSRIML